MILNMTYRVLNEDDDQLAVFPCEVNTVTGHVKCSELQSNSELFAKFAEEFHSVDMDLMDFAVAVDVSAGTLKIDQLPMFRTSASVVVLMQTGGLKAQAQHVATLADGSELKLPAVIDLDYGWVGTEAFSNPQILAGQIEDEYLVVEDIKIDIVRKDDYCAQETFEVNCPVPFVQELPFLKKTFSKIFESRVRPE